MKREPMDTADWVEAEHKWQLRYFERIAVRPNLLEELSRVIDADKLKYRARRPKTQS
ncbi:MAG: hypothetical protein JSR44_16680 [Spirochaetes bacterium]|nr:hypothetical protein [Spirochaetota bacterium]